MGVIIRTITPILIIIQLEAKTLFKACTGIDNHINGFEYFGYYANVSPIWLKT